MSWYAKGVGIVKGRKIQQTGEITGEHDAGSHTEAGK